MTSHTFAIVCGTGLQAGHRVCHHHDSESGQVVVRGCGGGGGGGGGGEFAEEDPRGWGSDQAEQRHEKHDRSHGLGYRFVGSHDTVLGPRQDARAIGAADELAAPLSADTDGTVGGAENTKAGDDGDLCS